jgi:flagellar biosynthesis GTPase FlhF
MKKCPKCSLEKDSSEYGNDKRKIDGLNTYCKECIRTRSKKQRESNPGYHRDYAERYRKKNKEVLRKKAWLTYYIDWEKRREQGKRSYEKHKKEISEKRAQKRRSEEEKEKNRKRQKEWRSRNPTKTGKIVANWKKKNPQKAAAHSLILWAIRTGVMIRPEKCEECGMKDKIQGHHENYLRPMEVKWLCRKCHLEKHRVYR